MGSRQPEVGARGRSSGRTVLGLPLHGSPRKAPGLGEKQIQGYVRSHGVRPWRTGLQKG